MKKWIFVIFFMLIFHSCRTAQVGHVKVSRRIADSGVLSAGALVNFFMSQNPDISLSKVSRIASYYIEEAKAEGINSDIAFAQMCLETGYLNFGKIVTADMNNFCGLGSVSENNRGEIFTSERMGVRAHIQHLHAYGTRVELKRECIDARYKWVTPRGKAVTVHDLSGTWAMDREYGEKLEAILSRMENFN